jgi:peptidoglycan/LPS O-acetylase OafA/YrhL
MSRGFSIYLDALRFFAAFLVFLSHFAYPRFSDGRWLWVREFNLGSDAVVIFFVLSGLVISHATHAKRSTAGAYAFDRATRLLSVAFPALLLSAVLDHIGSQIGPHLYAGWIYNPLPLWELLLRGLSFSNEWGGVATRLGTNGPYWSLSYEAAYYALFGIAIFTSGRRRIVLLAAGCLLFGINILLLMPAWLLGVAIRRVIASNLTLSVPMAVLCAIVPVVAYVMALALNVPELLRAPLAQFNTALRFSDEFIWNTVLALLVSLHLLGMAQMLREQDHLRHEARIRWLAGGSFSLYLVHYPVLQFLAAFGLGGQGFARDTVLMGCTLVACFAFAEMSERRLPFFRRTLIRIGRLSAKQTASKSKLQDSVPQPAVSAPVN